MRHRIILLLSALLASSTVLAQNDPPADSARDSQLATPSTTASSATPKMTAPDMHKRLPFQADAKATPFKFKDQQRRSGDADRPPPSANDKSAVMGTQRPWQSGKPPVDCTLTPHGDGC